MIQEHPTRPDWHVGDRVRRGAVTGIAGVLADSAPCEGVIIGFEEVQMFGPTIATVIQWDDGKIFKHTFADFRKIEVS